MFIIIPPLGTKTFEPSKNELHSPTNRVLAKANIIRSFLIIIHNIIIQDNQVLKILNF